jgi:hypothetical protein
MGGASCAVGQTAAPLPFAWVASPLPFAWVASPLPFAWAASHFPLACALTRLLDARRPCPMNRYGSGLGRPNGPSPLAKEAARQFIPTDKPARLIDRCVWNYQREHFDDQQRACRADFKCNQVIAMHKAYEPEHGHDESDTICYRHQVEDPP